MRLAQYCTYPKKKNKAQCCDTMKFDQVYNNYYISYENSVIMNIY